MGVPEIGDNGNTGKFGDVAFMKSTRILRLPIRKQYGVEVIIFYKTEISVNPVCPTTLKYSKTAIFIA